MARPLTDDQARALRCLRSHGEWHAYCGWVWRGERATMHLMDQLVEKAVVRTERREVNRGSFKETVTVYLPVELI